MTGLGGHAQRRRNSRERLYRKARRRVLCSYVEPTGRTCRARAGLDGRCLLHREEPR